MKKTIDELVEEYGEAAGVTVSAGTLGLLAFLASDYDRRLRDGVIPPRVWELLPQQWRDRINASGEDHRWERRK